MKSKDNILVLVVAIISGVIGHLICAWIYQQGIYGPVIPGAAVGIGASFLKINSKWIPITCGFLALAFGLFTEWRFAPFLKDDSLEYFLLHIQKINSIHLILIALGTFMGFWIPFGKMRPQKKTVSQSQ